MEHISTIIENNELDGGVVTSFQRSKPFKAVRQVGRSLNGKANKGTVYREAMATMFLNFPKHIDPTKLKVVGYLQGERVDRLKGHTVYFYDTVSFMNESPNANNAKPFIHAIGYNGTSKRTQTLILKQ